jgi:hypothetical protein
MTSYAHPHRLFARPVYGAWTALLAFVGPDRQDRADTAPAPSANWIASLCLSCACALMLIAMGQGAGRRGEDAASGLFWAGVVLLLLPTIGRIAWPAVARGERIFLLLLLTEGLFVYRLLYSPMSFVQFDEMLHWISGYDILHRHKLFLDNSLLPIGPYYPAIEIVTTGLANLAQLTVFPAAMLVIAVLRAAFIAALFLLFETLAKSPRIAAVACIAYMGCDNFVGFDSIFAYETLGIVLCVMAMMAEARLASRNGEDGARSLVLLLMLLAGLAVTHHVSAFVCSFYFIALLVMESLRRDPSGGRRRLGVLAVIAFAAVFFPIAWMVAIGDQLWAYLGPRLHSAVASVAGLLNEHHDAGAVLLDPYQKAAEPRQLFVSADGRVQPIGYRIIGVGSTLLIALGLASGFFRSLAMAESGPAGSGWWSVLRVARRQWRDSRILLLTLAAFGYPLSVVLRLTPAGWEIGNRMGAFIFVAVGLVAAVGFVHFWQLRAAPWRLAATNLAIGIVVLGGITIGSGNQAVQGAYQPGADPGSIEPMAIDAASWAKAWLGEGNRFAADRVNRVLLATYGQQDLISTLRDGVDESRIFVTDWISPDVRYWIRRGRIDYLLADLRITSRPSVLGEYYQADEANRGRPPPPGMLLKFDDAPEIGRIFDDGWIVIFDVRALHAGK